MSETALKLEIPGWYVEFQAALLRQAPRPGDIDQTTAEGWTKNQAGLQQRLAEGLLPPKVAVQAEKPKPTLLEPLGTVNVAKTTEPFFAKAHFVVNTSDDAPVKIWNIWEGFKTRFFQGDGKIEPPIGDTEMRYHRLKKRSVDTPILKELGGGRKPRTMLTEVFMQMKKQPKGENGTLLVNGYANIFYVETEVILPEEEHLAYANEEGTKVVLCAVRVCWSAGLGWVVVAFSVLDVDEWFDGVRVFSRNSDLVPSETPAPVQT